MESEQTPIVFGIGNTFIDCYANADHELLKKYDLGFGLPGNLEGEKRKVLQDLKSYDNYMEMPGGSTLNTLRALNHIMKNEYNRTDTCLYFGSIAKDRKGETIKRLLDKDGLQYKFEEHEEGYTGQCAIIIVETERTPVSDCGVNEQFTTSYLTQNMDLLSSCEILLVEGFFVSSNFEAITKVWEYAHEHNKQFAFNLCGEYWVETYKDKFLELIPNCDMIFGNLNEFKSLATILDLKYTTNEELVQSIASYKVCFRSKC